VTENRATRATRWAYLPRADYDRDQQ
jgi:hypothetical protein